MLLKPGVDKEIPLLAVPGFDKVLHFSIFGFLTFSFLVVFQKIKFWKFFQIMLIYALLTEILQEKMNMGRSLEMLDVVADMIGCTLGFYFYKFFVKIFFKNK